MDLVQMLVLGSYVFGAGCYALVWQVYQALNQLRVVIAALTVRVDNHYAHELDDIKRRLHDLEQ